MQFTTTLALLALSTGVLSQGLQITDSIGASVLQVLATAIPPEVISQATADASAFSADLESSLLAGKTPEWYQALPSDVKSYLPQLYPAEYPAETTAPGASSVASSAVASATGSVVVTPSMSVGPIATGSPTGGNATISTVSSATLVSTGGANSEISASPTGVFTGGAAFPTGFVSAGVAGAIGILGMLAL